jgi:exo-beta-1,3-glucanase (GH17 family)
MKQVKQTIFGILIMGVVSMTGLQMGCQKDATEMSAEALLGNSAYRAMSYSGWRTEERRPEWCPTEEEIMEDLLLMEALGIRFIRTYNTQLFDQATRILSAIERLRAQDPEFEMYVMLGAWIQCAGAYTSQPNHFEQDYEQNAREIGRALELARLHPEIVKVIAVGNEAMVTWQPHHVGPAVIQEWVDVVRAAREAGEVASDLWVTTSDNWAALGGEGSYQNDELLSLLRSLDFVSLHTYAFHDSYYYPAFEWARSEESELPVAEQTALAVGRALAHQQAQVAAVQAYMDTNGIQKAIHIGETGWATRDDSHYGNAGTCVADEFTSKLFHDAVREWTESAGMSCFYFQAFDEPWKSSTPDGSESHFGLFTNAGEAKAVIWEAVDSGVLDGLGRNGKAVEKTFAGSTEQLMKTVLPPRDFRFQPGQ